MEEKAKELIKRYIDIMPPLHNQTGRSIMEHAKQCAMISVIETINGILSIVGKQSYMWSVDEKETIEFWEQVKKQINLTNTNKNGKYPVMPVLSV